MKLEAALILEDWTHEKVCVQIMDVMKKNKKERKKEKEHPKLVKALLMPSLEDKTSYKEERI